MNYTFRLKSIATGTVDEEMGRACTIQAVLEMRDRMIGKGVWGSGYVVVDKNYEEYPHFFGTTSRYIFKYRKNKAGGLFNGWHASPGRAAYAFHESEAYQMALDMDPSHPLYGRYSELLDMDDWELVDHRMRPWVMGRDRNWADAAPNKPGTFALIEGHSGDSFGHTKKGALTTSWMKLSGLWRFCGSRQELRESTKVVENLGDGKWQYREDVDPWS